MPHVVKDNVIYRRGISLRLELHERERLHREAKEAGLSLQQFLRVRLGLGRDLSKRAEIVRRQKNLNQGNERNENPN